MVKKGQIFRKYSPEFKLSVILDMREHRLSYSETVRKYGLLLTSKGGAINTLQRWERKYLEEGYEGLMKDNRGRPSLTGKKRGRPPKLDKKVEEDLIAENQRLRMENEYLKKLSALVQERIKRENGKKQK
ncbi:MAG: helix-turn-helix domain-containing protein [Clostridia bacterium]|nr:helix-turn-helix domain-containing protein [Clostridia bacterium]